MGRINIKNPKILWYNLLFLWLVLGMFRGAHAQNQIQITETGIPPHHDFTPSEYKANGQNFSVLMDKRGLIYVANFAGILEYDGTNWRNILTKNISKVNSLAIDSSGTIYVGARGEIGFLQPDAKGEMRFISLLPGIANKNIPFPDVLKCLATPKGIYFITPQNIILWNRKSFTVTKNPSVALNAFYVNNKLYVMLKTGLHYLEKGAYQTIKGGNQFSYVVQINALLPYGPNELLAGSGNQGLFLINKAGIKPFTSEATSYLSQNKISSGLKLQDGTFAFGTSEGGVVVVEKNGQQKQLFNKNLSGLYDNKTNALFQDQEGGLWIALNRGLTHIELKSSLVYFNQKKNVTGNITGIRRYQEVLYISTSEGLFKYDKITAQFKKVSLINAACWDLALSGNYLIVATTNGVYAYNGQTAHVIMPGYALTIYPSQVNGAKIFVGLVNGLALIEKHNGQYVNKGPVTNITTEIVSIGEDENENVWLEMPGKGLMLLAKDNLEPKLYSVTEGLPNKSGNHINQTSAGLRIGTVSGIYYFNNQKNRFEKFFNSKLDSSLNTSWLKLFIEDPSQNIWVTAGDETKLAFYRKTGTIYKKDRAPLPLNSQQIFKIYPELNGQVWLGGADNLIAFNTNIQAGKIQKQKTLLRLITVNEDTLYRGTTLPQTASGQTKSIINQKNFFTSKENNVRFEFSTPMAMEQNDLQFQYYLQGLDEDSTNNWVPERIKEYSNLAPGDYIFRVKSRNIYGQESQGAAFAFAIAKPYYATWWAYLLYALLSVGMVLLFVRVRSQQLFKEKRKLEALIQERTEEVVAQKEELESQSQELASKNDELEKINLIVKSINSEIDFDNLMQAILNKTKIIRGTEKAFMLVRDKNEDIFRFKASFGYPAGSLEDVSFTTEDAENRYLSTAEEIYEDIYYIRSAHNLPLNERFKNSARAKSMLIMLLKLNHKTEAFLILENWQKNNTFIERDFSLLRNLKEHFIAAFIKTTLLEDIQDKIQNLKETQEQLVQKEKMASVGQLTKGLFDRILNPLNFINNLPPLSRELIEETEEYLQKPNGLINEKIFIEENFIAVKNNLDTIKNNGRNITELIKGLEKVIREKPTQFIDTDINKLIVENIEKAIQESKKEYPDNIIKVTTKLDAQNKKVNILPTEIDKVLSNLLSNAFFSVMKKFNEKGSSPEVIIESIFNSESVSISIRDNGKGISESEKKQLFTPYFTTKPTNKAVGLGLFLSLDIIKDHKGTIEKDTKEGEFAQFTINIPIRR